MVEILVYGLPAPQGSKRFLGVKGGKGIMVESSKQVKPWREAVKYAALEQATKLNLKPFFLVTGAVSIYVVFTLPKPSGAPKKKRTFPSRRPDIDKLVRSTLDALVSVGVIEDDSRVVWLQAAKTFPGESQNSLQVPGAFIRIDNTIPLYRSSI